MTRSAETPHLALGPRGRIPAGDAGVICSCYVLDERLASRHGTGSPSDAQGARRDLQSQGPVRERRGGPVRRRLGIARPGAPGDAAAADRGGAGREPHGDRSQPLAGHSVRAVDQSIPRLRARLHLLLRAAEPCLSGPVAGAGFRDQAARQVRRRAPPRGRARQARLSLPADRARHQHRSLPTGRAASADHPRHPRGSGAVPPPGDHRDQIGGGAARSRSAPIDGRGRPRAGRGLGHDARPQARPHPRAARGGAAIDGSRRSARWARRACRRGS